MSTNSEQSEMTQIGISDGIIKKISNQKTDGLLNGKNIIDANGQCLLPGFIDCHTHIVYANNRADEHALRLQGASYEEIHASGGGIQSSVDAVRNSSIDDLVQQSTPRIQNLLREGVTSLEIKSGYGLDTENELKMLRAIKQCQQELPVDIISTFLGAHTIPKGQTQKDYIHDVIHNMLPAIHAENLADFVDIYVEKIAFNTDDMTALFKAANKLNIKTRVHAEQLSNQQAALTAAKLNAYSADHLEFLDEAGAKAMGENKTVAVLLPSAFYFLRETKKPPIDLLRKHNVDIAVSTDCNPGTSPIPSILTALHFAVHLFALNPTEALMGITLNAAKALGIDKNVGSLEEGKQADLCLWDINSPNFLCYQLGGIKPTLRMHNGTI